jgi:hypothetical protein
MLQIKVLRTQQHLITDLIGLLNTILVCKRVMSLLSRNQTFACWEKIANAQRKQQTLGSRLQQPHPLESAGGSHNGQLKRGRTDGLVTIGPG